MDPPASQEKQEKKRLKLDMSDPNAGSMMGDNGGVSHVKGMDLDDSANSANITKSESDNDDDNDQLYALQSNIEYCNVEIQELQKELVRMRDCNNNRDLQYDLLVQTSVKKNKEVSTLKNRILDLEKRSMNRNIRINNLQERSNEDPERAVNTYLNSKIEKSNYDIEVAHRNGPKFEGDEGRTRPMIVQLKGRGMVEKVLKATRKEGAFSRKDVRVTRQVPTELRHITAKLYHLAEIAKTCHPNAKVEVKDNAIYINNQKRRTPLVPPSLDWHPAGTGPPGRWR